MHEHRQVKDNNANLTYIKARLMLQNMAQALFLFITCYAPLLLKEHHGKKPNKKMPWTRKRFSIFVSITAGGVSWNGDLDETNE